MTTSGRKTDTAAKSKQNHKVHTSHSLSSLPPFVWDFLSLFVSFPFTLSFLSFLFFQSFPFFPFFSFILSLLAIFPSFLFVLFLSFPLLSVSPYITLVLDKRARAIVCVRVRVRVCVCVCARALYSLVEV